MKAPEFIFRGLVNFISIILLGCNSQNELIDFALQQAGKNSHEIERVLSHYGTGNDKRNAAEYTVAAMPGLFSQYGAPMDSIEKLYRLLNDDNYWGFTLEQRKRGQEFCKMPLEKELDLRTISSDYLIKNIDDAWKQWKRRKWNKGVSFEQFCELILPYRIGDEKFTSWRIPYREWAGNLNDTLDNFNNSVEAALAVSDKFGRAPYNPRLKTPHRTAINLLEAPVGICREDCDRTIYAMRAHGVPVAIDEILVSPDYGGSHQWNVVYDTDDKIFRFFDNRDFKPTRDSIHNDQRRKGKVYRQTFAIQTDKLAKFNKFSHLPADLSNPRLKDVTYEYFGKNQAKVTLWTKNDENYLGIFTPKGIKPVDIGERKGHNVLFSNIEPNLIFFPIIPDKNKNFKINGFPFLLTNTGDVHTFEPNDKEEKEVTLIRKMPIGFLQKGRMDMIDGCYLQSSDSPDGPWEQIDSITNPYAHSYNRIALSKPLTKKYLRIKAPEGKKRVEIGEFIASTDSLAREKATLFPLDSDGKRPNRKKLVDEDILIWYTYEPKDNDEGIILRVESTEEINYLFLLPHNDDNFVVPDEEYELYYLSKDGWKSLGKKTSNDFRIKFNAPTNAVLWLRNNTKGEEEQIFIYKDGKQLFNYDLQDINLL